MKKLDISDDIELKNGKSNPFGWSSNEIWYENKKIGFVTCGDFTFEEGYFHTEEKEGKVTQVTIFKGE